MPKAARTPANRGSRDQAPPAPPPIGPSTPLGNYSADDVGRAIFASSAVFSQHNQPQVVWNPRSIIDGDYILVSTPSRFRATLDAEIDGLSGSQRSDAVIWARTQVLAQASRDRSSVDDDTFQLWIAINSVFQPPPIGNQAHGGGMQHTSHGGGSNIPPPPLPTSNGQGFLPPPPPFSAFQQFPNLSTAWN
jgi:hypothetical protein